MASLLEFGLTPGQAITQQEDWNEFQLAIEGADRDKLKS